MNIEYLLNSDCPSRYSSKFGRKGFCASPVYDMSFGRLSLSLFFDLNFNDCSSQRQETYKVRNRKEKNDRKEKNERKEKMKVEKK